LKGERSGEQSHALARLEMIQPFRSEYQRLSSAGLEDRETSSYPFRCRIERCANHFVVIRAKHNTCGGLGHYLLPAELTGFGRELFGGGAQFLGTRLAGQ
jgi:hypothetical protein